MKNITITGHIIGEPAPDWCASSTAVVDGIRYRFTEFADPESMKTVCAHTLTFDVPASFDAVGSALKALEEQREELRAKFQMAVNEINDRIGKLQALTNEVAA